MALWRYGTLYSARSEEYIFAARLRYTDNERPAHTITWVTTCHQLYRSVGVVIITLVRVTATRTLTGYLTSYGLTNTTTATHTKVTAAYASSQEMTDYGKFVGDGSGITPAPCMTAPKRTDATGL